MHLWAATVVVMDPLRIYDYLVRARGVIFDAVRSLDAAQYGRRFDIGPGSIASALTHTLISEWYYIARLEEREVPPYAEWPIKDEDPPPFAELEAIWARQTDETRTAIAAVKDWSAGRAYRLLDDQDRLTDVRCTAGDLMTQLAFHEVHHRAQVLNMLRLVGSPVADVDFNAMMYDRRFVEAGVDD